MVAVIPVSTPNELYAHAIAIEREAAERYSEFAQHMADEGNDQVATLFRTLAVFEAEHLDTLEARTKGNLEPDEARVLTQVLTDLRMNYLEEVKKAGAKAEA